MGDLRDLTDYFISFLKSAFGDDHLKANLHFLATALAGEKYEFADNWSIETDKAILRDYFDKYFYNDHLRTYRKRPIYWLYSAGKAGGFKALVYMHRYSSETTDIILKNILNRFKITFASG